MFKKMFMVIMIIGLIAFVSPAYANDDCYDCYRYDCYGAFQSQGGINVVATGVDFDLTNTEEWNSQDDYYYSWSESGSSLFNTNLHIDLLAVQAIVQKQFNAGECCPQSQSFHNYTYLKMNGLELEMSQDAFQKQGRRSYRYID